MPRPIPLTSLILSLLLLTPPALASAFVRGAHYRLGDDDPAAAAGALGNDPTRDAFADALHLSRTGSPHYSPDVPAFGPSPDKLSMAFANIGLGGPAFPGYYGRATALPAVDQGLALELWVKAGPTDLLTPTPPRNELLAYNGDPATSGFGLFLHDANYVARLGPSFERPLGPADVGTWHHLAYVYSLGTSTYYYDGKQVAISTTDPAPTVPSTDGFWLGGRLDPSSATTGTSILYPFNGYLDEVRFQSYNPLAAGAFDPAAFLITPEPTAPTLLAITMLLTSTLPRRHRRRSPSIAAPRNAHAASRIPRPGGAPV